MAKCQWWNVYVYISISDVDMSHHCYQSPSLISLWWVCDSGLCIKMQNSFSFTLGYVITKCSDKHRHCQRPAKITDIFVLGNLTFDKQFHTYTRLFKMYLFNLFNIKSPFLWKWNFNFAH